MIGVMKVRYYYYQLPSNNLQKFRKYNESRFDMEDYVMVWCDEIEDTGDDMEMCEKLYAIFNINHPTQYHGHSMSVSDFITFGDYFNKNRMYYCDDIGFKKVGEH